MNGMIIGILLLICLSVIVIVFQRNKAKQLKAENDARLAAEALHRQKAHDFYKAKVPQVREALVGLGQYPNSSKGYLNNYAFNLWLTAHKNLLNDISVTNYDEIGLQSNEIKQLDEFVEIFKDENYRGNYNRRFVEKELADQKKFFQGIESHGLDKEQQLAVVKDEDNALVIAGAGSGKTTTIIGKVHYLKQRYQVPASQILLISFTKKSANDISERLYIPGLEARTFNSFGVRVIETVEGQMPTFFDHNNYPNNIRQIFQRLLMQDEFLEAVTTFFVQHLKPQEPEESFETKGDYYQHLKDFNFKSYKTEANHRQGTVTYQREVMKSVQECQIANFLFFHNIPYRYEATYPHPTPWRGSYKPDFTITHPGGILYLEHFGVDRKGRVPKFFADPDRNISWEQASANYNKAIADKRLLHQQYNTPLIESYNYEMWEGLLFENLQQNLKKHGILLKRKTPAEIWTVINEVANDEVENFLNLIRTFIILMKSNNFSIQDVEDQNNTLPNGFEKTRNTAFISIVRPVFRAYQAMLDGDNAIDFSDMINRAAEYIRSGKYKSPFKYIIIDEFQDISIGRYGLVKALKDQNPECKLFCVGDDWQSIYRFTGSDIALYNHFEKYFGYTTKSLLTNTHRFHEPLIKLSTDFISKNLNQSSKKIKSAREHGITKYNIEFADGDFKDDTFKLVSILNEMAQSEDFALKDIKILSRYNKDFNRRLNNIPNILKKSNEGIAFYVHHLPDAKPIQYDSGIVFNYHSPEGELLQKEIPFLTVHKAKGLEADVIILLNCNAGKLGFPTEMSDDKVLNLLLSSADQFSNGEERRLFYVALTRAKEHLYLIAKSRYKSKFISELESSNPSVAANKCPVCKKGDIIKRSGPYGLFKGCSNYTLGCGYTAN